MSRLYIIIVVLLIVLFCNSTVFAQQSALRVDINGKITDQVYQDGSYTFHFFNPDNSSYSGALDVSMKDASGNYSSPFPYRDPAGNLLQVVNGNLTINLSAWRNSQTGQWINLGDYTSKFRPLGRGDYALSNEVITSVIPLDISSYWPFPSPGTYLEYKELPNIPPTRFRFDIEKNINATCGTHTTANAAVFRMTQTNQNAIIPYTSRFMGRQNFRFMLEWVGDNMHSYGIKKYLPLPEQLESKVLIPRGKVGEFGAWWPYSKTGYTSENLPSFYQIPKLLDFNFYHDDYFLTGAGNACDIFEPTYKWAMNIRTLQQIDLDSGLGQGNLQVGDMQIRFFEHNFKNVPTPLPPAIPYLNREDWFFRKNLGLIRVETARSKFTDECVENQFYNYSCWSNPNVADDSICNCWARRIHPTKITDGLMLDQYYSPHQLNFIFKETGTNNITLYPGQYYTLSEISSKINAYIEESRNPEKILQAYMYKTCGFSDPFCNTNPQLEDVWLEAGEVRLFIPPDTPPATTSVEFRSHIWQDPQTDNSGGIETPIEPQYPNWSNQLSIRVKPYDMTELKRTIVNYLGDDDRIYGPQDGKNNIFHPVSIISLLLKNLPSLTPSPFPSLSPSPSPSISPSPTPVAFCKFDTRIVYFDNTTSNTIEAVTIGPKFYQRNNTGWIRGDLVSNSYYNSDINAPCFGKTAGSCTLSTRTVYYDAVNKLKEATTIGPNYYEKNISDNTNWTKGDLASAAFYNQSPNAPCFGKSLGTCQFTTRFFYVEEGTNKMQDMVTIGNKYYVYDSVAGWWPIADRDLSVPAYYRENSNSPCYGAAYGSCAFDTALRYYDQGANGGTLTDSFTKGQYYYNNTGLTNSSWWPISDNRLGATSRYLEPNGPCVP